LGFVFSCAETDSAFSVLKTAGSSFSGFHRDQYTTLPGKFPSTHAFSELIDPPQTEVDDRLFSTSVDLKYDIQLPPNVPLTIANIPKIDKFADFQNVYEKTRQATLEVFATDESASVQATMYKTAQRVLLESPSIKSVTYAYPNKHYM
jgi:urate oxidase